MLAQTLQAENLTQISLITRLRRHFVYTK